MKKLSIEEKAKRYDEAIEELRGLLEGIHEEKCEIMEDDIIKIFPELKDSWDEKVRKDIIVYLQYSIAFDKSFLDKKYNWSQKDCSKWIAWLEKQGKQKPTQKNRIF